MKELLYLKDDQLKDLIEKIFIGYRETFSDSKKILDFRQFWPFFDFRGLITKVTDSDREIFFGGFVRHLFG